MDQDSVQAELVSDTGFNTWINTNNKSLEIEN